MYIIIIGAFITFMGEILPNHAYVDLSLVGTVTSDSVQCHTDLGTCCSRWRRWRPGVWYFPNRKIRHCYYGTFDICDAYQTQQVNLYRRNNANTSGIYRCKIPTNAVHDYSDKSVRESVYVGLYSSGGEKWEENV